jgi:hypothetical protein
MCVQSASFLLAGSTEVTLLPQRMRRFGKAAKREAVEEEEDEEDMKAFLEEMKAEKAAAKPKKAPPAPPAPAPQPVKLAPKMKAPAAECNCRPQCAQVISGRCASTGLPVSMKKIKAMGLVQMMQGSDMTFVSKQEASVADNREKDRLQGMHKLLLVLDIDLTLLHATADQEMEHVVAAFPPALRADVHTIQVMNGRQSQTFHVKYRPGLMDFLAKVSELFELWIYTAGTRPYAAAVASLLDPTGKLFRKVISRSDAGDICHSLNGMSLVHPLHPHRYEQQKRRHRQEIEGAGGSKKKLETEGWYRENRTGSLYFFHKMPVAGVKGGGRMEGHSRKSLKQLFTDDASMVLVLDDDVKMWMQLDIRKHKKGRARKDSDVEMGGMEDAQVAAEDEGDDMSKDWELSDCRNVIPVHPFRFFRGVADANASPSQASQVVVKSTAAPALARQPSSEAEWSDDEDKKNADLEPSEILAAKAADKAKAAKIEAEAKAAMAAEALTRAVPCAGSDRQLVHTWRLLQRVHETFYASVKPKSESGDTKSPFLKVMLPPPPPRTPYAPNFHPLRIS